MLDVKVDDNAKVVEVSNQIVEVMAPTTLDSFRELALGYIEFAKSLIME